MAMRRSFGTLVFSAALCTTATARAEEAPGAGAQSAPPAQVQQPVPAAALQAALSSAPAPRRSGKLKSEVHGSYRLLGWNQSDLALGVRDLGSEAERLGQTTFVEHRLRVGSLLHYGDLDIDLEIDAVNGLLNAPADGVVRPIAGPDGSAPRPDMADPLRNRSHGLSLDSFALRKAQVTWNTAIGKFAVGPTTFSWGQGMLANDGAQTGPDGKQQLDRELGDQRFGDRVLRAMYATKPLYYLSAGEITEDVTSVIGVDLLLQDETGSLVRPLGEWGSQGAIRDRGLQGIFALKHERGGLSSGLFVTRRSITGPMSWAMDPRVTLPFRTTLDVWVFDVASEYKRKLASGAEAYGALEVAYVTGDTNLVRNVSCPGGDAEKHGDYCQIAQGGAVVRGGVRGERLSFDLLGGYASGDGNPFDSTVSNFRFDRDFKAGLILFDQVLAWQSAGMVRRATDPFVLNVPTAGVELLSTSGAITNAAFVQPTVKYKLLDHTQLVGSVLYALAPQKFSDAFWMNRLSDKTNPFGQKAGGSYGVEVDAGVNYGRDVAKGVQLLFGVQGGLFLPGDAFVVDASGKTMDPVYLVKARTALVF